MSQDMKDLIKGRAGIARGVWTLVGILLMFIYMT